MNESTETAIMPVGSLKAAHVLVESIRDRIEAILPKHITVERALRVYQNAISRNKRLLECTPASIMNALITASEFGLEPNTPLGQCHIIPYKTEATFQIGYQGIVELAYRSGRVSLIYAETVHENDLFELRLGLHRDIVHEPNITGERGGVISYYAVVEIMGYAPQFAFMKLDEVYAHAKRYSKAYQSHLKGNYSDTPWKETPGTLGFDSMAKKTVLIQACKTAPKSIDDKFVQALSADDDIDIKGTSVPVRTMASPSRTLDDIASQLNRESIDRDMAAMAEATTVPDDIIPPEDVPIEPEPPKAKEGKGQSSNLRADAALRKIIESIIATKHVPGYVYDGMLTEAGGGDLEDLAGDQLRSLIHTLEDWKGDGV